MTAYVYLLIWILGAWIITNFGRVQLVLPTRYKESNLFLISAFFGAFLLMALRGDSVGADTGTYKIYFIKVSQLEWNTLFTGGWDKKYFSTEKAFMILEKVVSMMTDKGQWMLTACAAIYVGCIYYLVKKYCRHTLLAIMSFLCMGSYLLAMNLMRQSVAVGLCCVAWVELQKKNYVKTILWILFACMFHTSAVIFLVTILFKRVPADKKILIIATVMTVTFSMTGSSIVSWMLQFFPTYSGRYGKGRWAIAEANGIIFVWIIIAVIVIQLIFAIQWKREKQHFVFEIILCSMAYLGINIVGQSFDGVQRLSMYFQPFLIILFEEGGKIYGNDFSKLYYTGVVISMSMLFLRMSSTAQYLYIPCWRF